MARDRKDAFDVGEKTTQIRDKADGTSMYGYARICSFRFTSQKELDDLRQQH